MSTYSTNLGIELIGTGEQSGTWGTTTNTNLGTLIEQAISGYVTQAVATGTNVDLSTTGIPDGTSGVARNMYIELTGTGGANTNLIVPTKRKLYFIYNNTSSGQVTVKVSAGTGVSVANGAKVVLVYNGTDIVNATSYPTASGTTNYVAKFTGTNSVGNSIVYDDGTNVGIGTSTPATKLEVYGGASGTVTNISVSNAATGANFGVDGANNVQIRTAQSVNMLFYTAGTERARIDTSGRLLVGVTSGSYALDVGDVSGGNMFRFTRSGVELSSYISSGLPYFGTTSNTALLLMTNSTERARITSGGNFGIGTSSPSDKFVVAETNGNLQYSAQTSGYGDLKYVGGPGNILRVGPSGYNSGGLAFMYTTSGGTRTEAARVDSTGNFLIGKTASSASTVGFETDTGGTVISTKSSNSSGDASYYLYSTGAGQYQFYVSTDGTVNAVNTTIAGISDQRLKENVRDLDVGLDAVMALQPRKFDWKDGKGKGTKDDRGFIAQEFEQVFPDLVGEWKTPAPEGEEPYKTIRQDLIPVLVKAMQEQQVMIDDLRARIAQLESK